MPVGNRMKIARKALGLKQKEVARRLNISYATLSGIENERAEATPRNIDNFAKECGVSRTWLLSGEGDMLSTKFEDKQIHTFMGDALNGDSDFKRRFISVLSRMTEDEWEILERKILEIVEGNEEAAPD